MEISVELLSNSTLRPKVRPKLPPTVVVQEGDNLVLIVYRSEPALENTFDTGMWDELYLEFKDVPLVGETVSAQKALRAAFYQIGSVVPAYRSTAFEGTILITHWEPGVKVAGRCELRFSNPFLDRTDVGTLRVEVEL